MFYLGKKVIYLLKINGFYLSLIFHIILLILLSSQFNHKRSNNIIKTKKIASIQSFLYTPNKVIKSDISIEKSINQTKEKVIKKQQIAPPLSSKNKKNKKKNLNSTLAQTKKTITKQSLLNQVNSLNNMIPTTSTYKKQPTIKSIFNRNPILVKKSNTRSEQQKESDNKLKVTDYGHGIAIQKNKDGNCSITQDLSLVGIEGVSTTQYFKCGKSEFDKSFEQHIKNVMKKYK